jgi:hypothetical protein
VVRAMPSARQRSCKHEFLIEGCFLRCPCLGDITRFPEKTESSVESIRTEEYKDENGACPSDL